MLHFTHKVEQSVIRELTKNGWWQMGAAIHCECRRYRMKLRDFLTPLFLYHSIAFILVKHKEQSTSSLHTLAEANIYPTIRFGFGSTRTGKFQSILKWWADPTPAHMKERNWPSWNGKAISCHVSTTNENFFNPYALFHFNYYAVEIAKGFAKMWEI